MRIEVRKLFAAVAVSAVWAGTAAAQGPAAARAEKHGFDAERLGRIESALQQYVDDGQVAGAVALVMRDGEVVYEHAVGWIDREAQRRMPTGAIFRIASQTKAITSTAVMMLVEEGKIALNDPVSRWIPTFANTTVAVRSDSGVSVVPALRRITIRDLLTHSSGISYGGEPHIAEQYQAQELGYGEAYGWYTADDEDPICDKMERLGTLPFVQQPGAAWVYGYSTDVLGCVVERASGAPLDRFIGERITEPLGMADTYFYLPPAKSDRLATVYAPDSAGRAIRAPEGARGQGHYVEGPRRSFAGGAGLLSTARDYARFLEMVRRGGELDGVRILSPQSIALMTTNQVGELRGTNGVGFGLGFETVERMGASGYSSEGNFGWSGAYGSSYEVDPSRRLVMVMMMQLVPFAGLGIRDSFETAVYQALVEP
jgi:CubicO group peptidase (beta-lactamase class C family)